MKSNIYLSLVALFLLLSCNGCYVERNMPTKYYRYNGKKIPLTPVSAESYILIDPNVFDVSSFPEVKDFHLLDNYLYPKTYEGKRNLLYGILKRGFSKKIYNKKGVIYHSPSYIVGGSDNPTGVTHLFNAKLKPGVSYSQLEELAKKYNVEILGNNNLMPLWYTFACTKKSAGDAIDMANAFYESGLCIYAEPDIMHTIIIDDSEHEPI